MDQIDESLFKKMAGQETHPYRRLVWAAGFVLAIMLLFGSFVLAAAQGSHATLVVQQGQAILTKSSNFLAARISPAESVVPAGQVQTVKSGDEISLPAGAAAELHFFDGSSVSLGENTRLVVQELATSQSRYRVRLQQMSGATLSRVMRLLGVDDIFEITTPSSTVSVRGTEFIVAVPVPDQS
jgi:hypothetical protein